MTSLAQRLAQGKVSAQERSSSFSQKEEAVIQLYDLLSGAEDTHRALRKHLPRWIQDRVERGERLEPSVTEKNTPQDLNSVSDYK